MPDKSKFEVRNPEAEARLKDIGGLIRARLPKGFGFALFLFEFEGQSTFYVSNAERETLCQFLLEFVQKHRPN